MSLMRARQHVSLFLPLIWPRAHGFSFSFQPRAEACSKIQQRDTTSVARLQTVLSIISLISHLFSHDVVLTGKCMNSWAILPQ